MTLDVASSYLLSKTRLSLAEQQMKVMQAQGKTTELQGQLTDLKRSGAEGKLLTLIHYKGFPYPILRGKSKK